MLVIKKEEKDNLIYTTYEGEYSEFPSYDDKLGTRLLILTNAITGKYRAKYSQFKKENFISKVRALAEQNKGKEFSLKYPDLANRIEDAASRGLFQLDIENLNKDEFNALNNEGFEIISAPYCSYYIIKW